jgi:phage terminase large subunit-like protein
VLSRAVALETSRGWRITKEKQAHKIDVVVALAMAAHAAVKGQNDSTYSLHSGWLDDGPPPPPKYPPGMSEEQYKRTTSPPDMGQDQYARFRIPPALIPWDLRGGD